MEGGSEGGKEVVVGFVVVEVTTVELVEVVGIGGIAAASEEA